MIEESKLRRNYSDGGQFRLLVLLRSAREPYRLLGCEGRERRGQRRAKRGEEGRRREGITEEGGQGGVEGKGREIGVEGRGRGRKAEGKERERGG